MKKIYLIAPSFGCATEPYITRLKEAIKNLKNKGFQIIEGPNIYLNKDKLASNTKEERALEFINAYKSDTDIIMSVGGGEIMNEIIPLINFDELKQYKPKLFIGFSDNTNLTFTLAYKLGIKTIYGPCAPSFYDLSFDKLDTLKMINGELHFEGYDKWELDSTKDPDNPLAKLNLTERKVLKSYNYNNGFDGILLGGCLDCIITLCGTKEDTVREYVKDKKIIWFLEACDLSAVGIKRALYQLKSAGYFDTAEGFLIGRPLHYNENYCEYTNDEAVIDVLGDLNKPIILDVDLGHLPPSLPVLTNAHCKVKINDENNIVFDYQESY